MLDSAVLPASCCAAKLSSDATVSSASPVGHTLEACRHAIDAGSSSLGGSTEVAPGTTLEDSSSQLTPKPSPLLPRVCHILVWQVTLTANTGQQCAATMQIYAAFLL